MITTHDKEARVTFIRPLRGMEIFKIGSAVFYDDERFIKAFSPDIPATRFMLTHHLDGHHEFVVITDPDESIVGLLFDKEYSTVLIRKARLLGDGEAREYTFDVDYDQEARKAVLDFAFLLHEEATARLKVIR